MELGMEIIELIYMGLGFAMGFCVASWYWTKRILKIREGLIKEILEILEKQTNNEEEKG